MVVSFTAKVLIVKHYTNTTNRFARIIQKSRFNRTIHLRFGHQYNKDNLGALSALNQPAGFSKVQLECVTKHIKLSDKPRLSAVVSLNCNFCIAKCHSRRCLGTKDVDIHSFSHLYIHPSIHSSPKGQSEQLANRLAKRIGCRCLSLPYTAVVLVQVWVVPLRRPRPARDEGTDGLVLRALSGVHHDCCLSPLIDRSCPVALVSSFRSDCVSASRVPRRHFSFSLSPSAVSQPKLSGEPLPLQKETRARALVWSWRQRNFEKWICIREVRKSYKMR